ncbi:MAG: hypothetical protein GX654_11360 [Desulfatiglans sp.]|nr:hypothetical protein [Desulfatiglans sp.]
MFENPHIIYIIAKMKHEELLNESRMNRLANEARKINKKNKPYTCRFILYIADLLIKTGMRLKRGWSPEVDDLDIKNILSEEDRNF